MNSEHPRRADFPSDVAFWHACALHLDELWPLRREYAERAAAYRRIDPEAIIERIHDLLTLDRDFTDAEAQEWQTLTAEYHGIRQARNERASR